MGLLHYFSQDGKIGYKNDDEEIIIQPQYDDGPSSFGRYDAIGKYNEYCYVVQNDKYGILHQSGELTIPCIYRDAHPLFDDLFAVKKRTEHNKLAYGVINSKSEIIIPFEYIKICSSGKYIQCYKEQSSNVDAYHREPIGDQFWFNSLGTLVHIGQAYRALGENLITMDKVHNSPNKQQLGLIDNNGNVILNNEYDQIDSASNGCYIVRVNDGEDWRVGVVKHDGNLLIPLDYKSIKHHGTNFFECFLDCDSDYQYDNGLVKRYSYSGERQPHWYNYDGKLIHDDEGRTLNEQFLAISKNGMWGISDSEGNRVVNINYDDVHVISGKILVIKDENLGFLNYDGSVIIPPSYVSIESACIDDKIITNKYNKKYGKYSVNYPFSTVDCGPDLIRAEVHSRTISRYRSSCYQKDFDFSKIIILRTNSYEELFSINEGILPNSRYDQISLLSDTFFAVREGQSWGVYNADEKELIIPCEYQQLSYEGDVFVLVQKDNLWGGLTLLPPAIWCDVEIPPSFLEIKPLYDPHYYWFGVKISEVNYKGETIERYTIVDVKGKEHTSMNNFDNITSQFTYYRKDRILCSIDSKYGFISLDGYYSIPFIYDEIIEMNDSLFSVRIDKSWGVLSLDKGEIVPVKYMDPIPYNFANCIVIDEKSGKYGMLSENGTEKIPSIYDHLIIEKDYLFIGVGGCNNYTTGPMFSGVNDAMWGCMDKDANILVPIQYDCIKINSEYLLAGRDAELFTNYHLEHSSVYTGVYDLYNKKGELLIGGFRELEYIEEHGIFKFLFGGKWTHERDLIDEWNNIHHEYDSFDKRNARWLITDKELRSIKLTKENTPYIFDKGFKLTIEKGKKNNKIVNYWNCSLDIFFKSAPKIVGEYLIAENEDQYYVIRLSDGKETVCYDDIEYISENLFFVRNGDYVGIVNFDGNIILPINYVALTHPVNSFIFGVTEVDDGICDVDLIDISSQVPKEYCAVSHAKLSDVLSRIKYGMFGIYINDDSKGLKSISVYRKHIFDQDFQNLIASYEEENKHKKFSQRYWFSGHSDLREKQSYKDDCDDNDDDYMRDSWDAMTDGMYGDMPDGFDGDYSFLGYD